MCLPFREIDEYTPSICVSFPWRSARPATCTAASLTETPVPFRSAPSDRLRCCASFWIRKLGLNVNLRHWQQHEPLLRSLDSNFDSKMQSPIVDDGLLLGDLTYAKAAHAVFLPDWKWHQVPSSSQAGGPILGINMGTLLGLRALQRLCSGWSAQLACVRAARSPSSCATIHPPRSTTHSWSGAASGSASPRVAEHGPAG